MDKGIWKEAIGKDTYKKIVRSCNRDERRICAKEGESVPLIKERERGGVRVHKRAVEKRLHSAVKVTTNSASVLCGEEEWEEEDGARLSIS